MSLSSVSSQAARQMQEQGAWLIDIRAPDEHARERMAGARSMPMERLVWAMERSGWVQAKAARLLKISPRQMGYALQKHGIEVRKF